MTAELVTAAELAPLLRRKPKTILDWHRAGTITAEVALGRGASVLFDADKVLGHSVGAAACPGTCADLRR